MSNFQCGLSGFFVIIENNWLIYWFWYLLSIAMFLLLILCWFFYWIANIFISEKVIVMTSKVIAVSVFLIISLSFLNIGLCKWYSICEYEYLGVTGGLTFD